MKLFLSTPCYGGLCLEKYFESIVKLQVLMCQRGHQLSIDTTENESLVHRARNVSVGRFMQKSDADYFMFIDADVHFDAQSVIELLESNYDISVACYPKKVIMWDQAHRAIKNGDKRSMEFLTSSLVVNFGKQNMSVENNFIEILDGPTGFMMIKRDVFFRMSDKYPDLYCVNDHQNRDFDNYYALFDCMIDPVNKRYLSEDYAFCRRWQQMGGKIHAHISTTLGHVGNLPFSGKLSERLKVKSPKLMNEAEHDSGDSKSVSNGENTAHSATVECSDNDEGVGSRD